MTLKSSSDPYSVSYMECMYNINFNSVLAWLLDLLVTNCELVDNCCAILYNIIISFLYGKLAFNVSVLCANCSTFCSPLTSRLDMNRTI